MKTILKGAIYCRVSTDDQETNGLSLPYQKESCLKYARENKLNISEDYIFLEQFSGGYLDRPMLNHILLLATKGLIDFVIITKRDRVARDQYVFQKIIKDLSDANVKIFYSEEKLTGDAAMDSFMGSTIIGFASWEREQIKLRTMAGKKQHAKENKWPFGHVPYGYIKNPETKKLEIYKEEKNIIIRIVENYLEDNMKLGEIAKKLTEDKILPPSMSTKGSANQKINIAKKKSPVFHWSATTVQRIISKASVYTGLYQSFSKQYKKIGAKSEFIGDRPREEWISIEIPRIISDKQAELLLETLSNNRKYAKKKAVRSYMLQGKLFCDCEKCLHNFTGYFHNPKQLRNYRCSLNNTGKVSEDRRCKNQISGLKIEGIVIDTLRELFTDPEYLLERALEQSFDGNKGDKDRYHDLYYQISEISEKHKRNEELYIDGAITKTRFSEIKNDLDIKSDDLHKEMGKELDIIKSESLQEDAMKNIGDIIKHLKESIELFFDNASYDELKELVGLVVEKVVLPVDKTEPVRIIIKIPADNLGFATKYYEEEFITHIDENGRESKISPTGDFIPKLLELDKLKSPIKYRTVEFSEDDRGNGDSGLNTGNRFLKFIKGYYHQFYKLHQSLKKQK